MNKSKNDEKINQKLNQNLNQKKEFIEKSNIIYSKIITRVN